MPDTSLVLIGAITTPFGVRGEVKVAPLLDDPAYLKRLPGVILQWDGGVTETRLPGTVTRRSSMKYPGQESNPERLVRTEA